MWLEKLKSQRADGCLGQHFAGARARRASWLGVSEFGVALCQKCFLRSLRARKTGQFLNQREIFSSIVPIERSLASSCQNFETLLICRSM